MKISCGKCHTELREVDLVVMDDMNTLFHRHCYRKGFGYQKDVGTYGFIEKKYSFFSDASEESNR